MLMRFDPFHELDRLSRRVAPWETSIGFPMDVRRDGDALTVELDIPGVDPADIDVTVQDGQLTVRAERTWQAPEGAEVVASERVHGTITRRLSLGDSLDSDRLDASYDNGVLTLRIPVSQSAQTRKIEVGRKRPALVA